VLRERGHKGKMEPLSIREKKVICEVEKVKDAMKMNDEGQQKHLKVRPQNKEKKKKMRKGLVPW